MLKLGIIGTGKIFDLNILGYLNNDDVQINCLCNRTIERAKTKIQKFNLTPKPNIYSDYNLMLDKEELDLVEILLPHHLHSKATIAAAEKGIKAISVQKPIALSLEDADQMIKSCEESGSILSIYENFLFLPHILKAKKLIDDDYIGDITSIRIKTAMGGFGGWDIPNNSQKWRKIPEQVGGGINGSPVLLDNGWHAFSLARWLVNEEIEKVFAWTGKYEGIDAPAYVLFKYKQSRNHVVPQYGQMEFTLIPGMNIPSKYYPTDEFIEIIATRGIIKINQGTSIGNKMTQSEIFAPIIIIRDGKVELFKDVYYDWNQSFINATKHFIEVAKNENSPILSANEAKKVLQFNLAAIKSAEEKREIVVDAVN